MVSRRSVWVRISSVFLRALGWVVGLWVLLHPVFEGDTTRLIRGAHEAVRCWSQGTWSGCSQAEYFSLFQYLILWPLLSLGAPDAVLFATLSLSSALAIGGVAWLGYRSLNQISPQAARLYLLGLATSQLYRYGQSSFAEGASVLPVFLMAWAVHERRSLIWVVVASFFAAVSKDTAAPFLLAILGIACWPHLWERRRWMLAGAGGAVCGVAAGIAFNYFRYSKFYNQYYFHDPIYLIRDPELIFHHLLGLWFSPNGGLIFVAPILFLALGSVLVKHRSIPGIGTVLMWLGLTVGFAQWFAPFGWLAWGSRLVVPWIPVSLYLLLLRHPNELSRSARLALSGWRGVIALSLLWVVTLPHFLALFQGGIVPWLFDTRKDVCPGSSCIYAMMWPDARSSWHAKALGMLLEKPVYGLVGLVYALGLLAAVRRVLAASDRPTS